MAGVAPSDRFRVSEVYRSIQGESSLVGCPTVFVRLFACNLRCVWCDSQHAVEGAYEEVAVDEAVRRVRDLAGAGITHVCWTGGEPLLQGRAMARAMEELPANLLHSVETNGEVAVRPLADALPAKRKGGLLRFVMDVKCPGSGVTAKLAFENLRDLRRRDEVKFVLLDRMDYEFARNVVRSHHIHAGTVLFSPVTPGRNVAKGLDPADLAAWILEDGLDVRLQLQMHKFIWPGKERGT